MLILSPAPSVHFLPDPSLNIKTEDLNPLEELKPLLQQMQEHNCFAFAEESLTADLKQPSCYLIIDGAGFVTWETLVATRQCGLYQ